MSAAFPAATAPAACCSSDGSTTRTQKQHHQYSLLNPLLVLPRTLVQPPVSLSRYESQKRRDWNTFLQYLSNHRPPLALSRWSGAHVLEFMKYLDQFGKTKVHAQTCPFLGHHNFPAPCPCPLRQAWGSLDALIGRLRAAFEENGGRPATNPFGARAVRLFLREVREAQAKARGFAYEKRRERITTIISHYYHNKKNITDE